MKVLELLSKARVQLQALNLKQTGNNSFSKYFYFELKDFLPHINNIFLELGICGVVTFTNELATLTIYCIEDKSKIEFTSPMASANLKGCHDIQNIGAVETYQRRYLYMIALEIVESDIINSSESSAVPTKEQTDKRAKLIKALEESAQKGSDAMGKFWTGLSVADQKLIGEPEKIRIYQIAKAADNGTKN